MHHDTVILPEYPQILGGGGGVTWGGDVEGGAEGHLSDKAPRCGQRPVCGNSAVDQRIIVLERGSESGIFQHCPDGQLVHGRGMVGPAVEIFGVSRKAAAQGVDDIPILEEEHRAAPRGEAAVDLRSASRNDFFIEWHFFGNGVQKSEQRRGESRENAIFVIMKQAIEIFAALGERLRGFGSEAASCRAIEAACQENGWFTPREVRRAVAAICAEMLCREKMAAWMGHYPTPVAEPRNVLVVMAGNIPLVGFFDMMCVVCAGHRCLVKPSAKDRVLTEYMIDTLQDIDPEVKIEYYGGQRVDAVIATGSDNANRYFRAEFGGVPSLLRGSRQSVAVLSGEESAEQLRGLADDIWAYSGLGCRNVSLVFAPEGYTPRLVMPEMNDKYRNNYRQQRALMEMRGEKFADLGSALMVGQRAFPTALSVVALAHYTSREEVEAWLAEHDGELQCVVAECIPHSRRVGFGQAQSPSLTDYADERDVMEFLLYL